MYNDKIKEAYRRASSYKSWMVSLKVWMEWRKARNTRPHGNTYQLPDSDRGND